jgi:hypothetical protein
LLIHVSIISYFTELCKKKFAQTKAPIAGAFSIGLLALRFRTGKKQADPIVKIFI